jgi:hypothetical protein
VTSVENKTALRCTCSLDCETDVPWLARALLADCVHDGKCECACHDFASDVEQARKRAYEAGFRFKGES